MADDATSWSETESAVYRTLSRYAVPDRERQIEIMISLIGAAALDGPILDLCCGEGLVSEAILKAMTSVTVHAFDGSTSMLDDARQRIGESDRLVTREIDLGADDWRRTDVAYRAVVSSLAVHHLDGEGKRKLFADIHTMLAPGGVFVLADVIRPARPVGHEIAAELWDEAVKHRSLALDGTLAGYQAFRRADWNHFRHEELDPIDKPSTLVEHLDWLRSAGFADVDAHWMTAGQVLLSGWKH
ncbi:MAG: class I SAM-dependent methyltransferase [Alphaproteobacteria bacterium]